MDDTSREAVENARRLSGHLAFWQDKSAKTVKLLLRQLDLCQEMGTIYLERCDDPSEVETTWITKREQVAKNAASVERRLLELSRLAAAAADAITALRIRMEQ